ncbi:MAG: DUF4340 domain-containing protein, partial [Opitutaceae bacterium]
MRTKVTLVLLLLNVVLFFIIFRVERAWRTESVALEVRRRVLGAEAADIRAISVQSAGAGESYRLERRGDQWFVTQPWVWRANPNAVSRIVADLQFLNDETSFSVSDVERNGQKLADYGLDPAGLTVTLSSGGDDATGRRPIRTVLRIGSSTKVGQRLYVLSPDGTRIDVVGRTLLDGLMLPLERLRSDAVMTIPFYEARSLNLQTPSGSRILIQRDGSRWTFETPISARASRTAMELAIGQLDALRAKDFAPQADPLPASSTMRIAVEGDNRRETLFLGLDSTGSGETPAQLEDLSQPAARSVRFSVMLPPELRAMLSDPVDDLRDPHVVEFDPSAVTSVTLKAPGEADLLLQRLEPAAPPAGGPMAAAWQILLPAKPGQGPRILRADSAAVRDLLAELAGLTARKFKSDAPTDADLDDWGFNRPERTIVISQPPSVGAAAAPGTITLQITQTGGPDSFALARVTNTPSVYAIYPDILRDTPVAPRDWRDRLLRAPDSTRVAALRLIDLSSGKVLWAWPDGTAAHRNAAAGDLAADILQLRARRFVADAFDSAGANGRPWRYKLEATLDLPDGGAAETRSVHALYFGERTGGSEQLAGAPEFHATFIPEQRLVDDLWKLTYA